MDNVNIDKILKDFKSHEEYLSEKLQDEIFQKEFLRVSIEEYAEDGDFKEFFRSLEQVIKARGSVRSFAEKIDIDRSNLCDILNGKTIPRIDTLNKILKGLGASITIKTA